MAFSISDAAELERPEPRVVAAPQMAQLVRLLEDPLFQIELRHLLRRTPAVAHGVLDAGVMCRDSAILVAMLAARCGVRTRLCVGKAAIFGPALGGRQGCLLFESHGWSEIEGIGLCDFSPDLRTGAIPGGDHDLAGYLLGSYRPALTKAAEPLLLRGDLGRYRAEVDARTAQPPTFSAVYLEEQARPFDDALSIAATAYAQSVLVEDLRRLPFATHDIYVKAALHLWHLCAGRRPSLAALPQLEAWAAIAAMDSTAAEEFRQRFGR